MKYILSVAILALSTIVGSLAAGPPAGPPAGIPPPPLDCNVVTPVKGDVWTMGKPQTVTWGCKAGGPLENLPTSLLMHIDLGTGTPDNFVYTDTIDGGDKLRDVKFTFILLTKYTPGDYLIRIRSRNRGDVEPVTAEEANKLKWAYSPTFKIVAAGGSATVPPGQATTGGNSTTTNSTSTSGGSSTGGSTGGNSTSGSSTGGSSTGGSANNTAKPTDKSTAGIVNVNVGVFFTTVMAAFVAAAFF